MSATISVSHLQIAQPCHENWASMTQEEQGAFCKVCNKHVHDFTNHSEEEILSYLKKHEGEGTCARVRTTVLNVPVIHTSVPLSKRNLSRIKLFACVLYLVFGSLLFSCNSNSVSKLGEIQKTTVQVIEGNRDTPGIKGKLVTMGKLKRNTKPNVPGSTPTGQTLPSTVNLDTVVINGRQLSSTQFCYTTNGCIGYTTYILSSDDSFPATDTLSLPAAEPRLRAYPNPASSLVNIAYEISEDGNAEIDVFNLAGVLIKQVRSDNNVVKGKFTEQINTGNYPSGMYILRLINNTNKLTTKFLVQH